MREPGKNRKAKLLSTCSLLVLVGLAFGCGAQGTLSTGPDIPYPSPDFGTSPDTPNATSSVEPTVAPSAAPTLAPSTTLLRTIGAKELREPAGLTAFGDYVIVCDQGPVGTSSTAIRYGRDGNRQGTGYGWPNAVGSPVRLAEASGVSTDGTVVYVADSQGVYGFDGARQVAFNLGNPYLPLKIKDLVQTGTQLYLLGDEFSSYSIPAFKQTFKLSETGNGLGIDKDGRVWLAKSTSLTCYEEGKATRTIENLEGIRDVAVDPRNNDLYALTSHEVLRFDEEDNVVSRFGTFSDAVSLAIDAEGYLYVSDRGKKGIEEFGPSNDLPS